MDPGRSPCPYRLIDDTGGAFLIGKEKAGLPYRVGAIGGAGWHLIRGFRNSPKGSHMQGMVYAVKTRAPALGGILNRLSSNNGVGNFAIWGLLYSAFDCTFAAIRRKEDVWNSILSGGLSGGVLAMRGGFKVFGRNFLSGAFLLGLIEGFNIMLSSYTTKKYNEQLMEFYGFDGMFSLLNGISFGIISFL